MSNGEKRQHHSQHQAARADSYPDHCASADPPAAAGVLCAGVRGHRGPITRLHIIPSFTMQLSRDLWGMFFYNMTSPGTKEERQKPYKGSRPIASARIPMAKQECHESVSEHNW